jgi:hypothetical protein
MPLSNALFYTLTCAGLAGETDLADALTHFAEQSDHLRSSAAGMVVKPDPS